MKNIVLSTLGIIVMFLGLTYVSYMTYQALQAEASTMVGQEYKVFQATSSLAATTNSKKTMSGSIGSFVVSSSSSASKINLYDTAGTATTTSATTTLLMSFDARASNGTYQYDVEFTRGLLIEVTSGFAGDVVLTYR